MSGKRLFLGFVSLSVLGAIALAARGQDQPVPQKRRAIDDYPPFEQVTEGFETQSGFFTLYRKKNQVLMEVPDHMLGRVFLLAMSVSGGSTLAGHQIDD